MKTLEERFWSKVNKGADDECWEWTAGIRGNNGYGGFSVGSKMVSAHRVSYELSKGSIPDDMRVLHSCDNPLCVNPNHLSLGTQLDNIRDRCVKGRTVALSGQAHSRAKLTDADAKAIRCEYASGGVTQQTLADRFCVSRSTIYYVLHGKHWKSADCPETNKKFYRCKLTDNQVRVIRQRYIAGNITLMELAAEYGVDHSNIGLIVNGLSRRTA